MKIQIVEDDGTIASTVRLGGIATPADIEYAIECGLEGTLGWTGCANCGTFLPDSLFTTANGWCPACNNT